MSLLKSHGNRAFIIRLSQAAWPGSTDQGSTDQGTTDLGLDRDQVYQSKVNSENSEATIEQTQNVPSSEINDQLENKNVTLFDQVRSEVDEQLAELQETAAALKQTFINALGESLVESFNFRTCVQPTLTFFSGKNEYKIRYTSLTADTS